jgi:hypothetical protein
MQPITVSVRPSLILYEAVLSCFFKNCPSSMLRTIADILKQFLKKFMNI